MFPIRSILSLSGMFLLLRPIRPPPILAYLNPSIHGPHFYLSLHLNSSHGFALVGGGGWGMHGGMSLRTSFLGPYDIPICSESGGGISGQPFHTFVYIPWPVVLPPRIYPLVYDTSSSCVSISLATTGLSKVVPYVRIVSMKVVPLHWQAYPSPSVLPAPPLAPYIPQLC